MLDIKYKDLKRIMDWIDDLGDKISKVTIRDLGDSYMVYAHISFSDTSYDNYYKFNISKDGGIQK